MYLKKNNPTSIHPIFFIFFSGVDLRVENIQLFFHRRVHTGVRDENVGTGTSTLREGQVRIRIVQSHKRWIRREGLTLILISPHMLLHYNFVLIRRHMIYYNYYYYLLIVDGIYWTLESLYCP